jgi:hypothetical protein
MKKTYFENEQNSVGIYSLIMENGIGNVCSNFDHEWSYCKKCTLGKTSGGGCSTGCTLLLNIAVSFGKS